MTKSEFMINTDDGKNFCKCIINGDEVVYESKEGRIKFNNLMEQTYGKKSVHPFVGRRGRKSA